MKKSILVILLGVLLCGTTPSFAKDAGGKNRTSPEKWTEAQKMSYILGTQIGQLSKTRDLTLDKTLIMRGMDDQIKDKKLAISPQKIQEFMAEVQRKEQEKQMAAQGLTSDANLKKGTAYLAKNKKKKGVTVTASGLQYKVIKKGKGPTPKATDKVKVHYRGTFIDGTEFDSSYKRNKPAVFGVSQVIKGWVEGLQLMNVGSKYELYIPQNLAYGKNAPPSIGPNQALVFEVELIEINK